MAFDLDGAEFVGLDDDVVGDGQTDSLPVDVFLQQTLNGNTRYLAQGRNVCTLTYWMQGGDAATPAISYAKNTGDRPWASPVRRSTLLCIPFYLEPGMTGVHVSGLYNVQSEGSDQNDVQLTYRIETSAGRYWSQDETLSNTDNAGKPDYTGFHHTIDFAHPWAAERELGMLQIWLRSEDGGDTGNNLSMTAGFTAATGDISNPGNDPTGIDFQYARSDDRPYQEYGYLGVDLNGTGQEFVYIWPKPVVTHSYDATRTHSLRYATYMQMRSISLEPVYSSGSLSDVPRSELQAKSVIYSRDAALIAGSMGRLRNRPRMLSFGPPGQIEDRHESWPTQYSERWEFVDGDATTAAEKRLIDDMVIIDAESVDIEVDILCVCSAYQFGGPTDPMLDLGEAAWAIDVDITQMDGGDTAWSAATSVGSDSRDVTLPVRAALGDSQSPLLLQLHLMTGYGTVAGATNHSYAFRDGQLFAEDIPIIAPVRMRVTTTIDSTRNQLPLRVRVEGALSDGGDFDDANLRLTVVGYSIYQVPTDG